MSAQASSGLSRRRVRLTDEETEQRMLDAALHMVEAAGLTVSLEHISFEEVIRAAGVSRSTVYRRWPHKDMFFSDLLLALARGTSPAGMAESMAGADLAVVMARHRLDWLDTAEGRHALLVEILRLAALRDFRGIAGSPQWRTYLALHATFLSLTDEELRTEVRTALAESEQVFQDRIAAAYTRLAEILGYRLRLGTFTTLAGLLSATMRGLVLRSLSDPDGAVAPVEVDPFGTGTAEWSQPGLAVAGIALSYLEPDPAVTWDDRRIATVRTELASTWFK